jgi:Tol biopolymer transport system component
VLSPDGNNVAYSAGNLLDTLFEKDALGAGEEKTLYTKAGEAMFPSDWSSDGRFLLYDTEGRPNTGADIWILPLEGEHKDPVLLLGTPSDEAAAAFSPDMHWIAYISNESGRFEAYVREFIASGPSGVPAVGDKRWQVSRDGSFIPPRWSRDSKEIYFGDPNGGSMAVDMSKGPARMGIPRELGNVLKFKVAPMSGLIAPDGKRWLVSVAQKTAVQPFTVVLNWPALLKK